MSDEIFEVFTPLAVNMDLYPMSDLNVSIVKTKVPIKQLDVIMDMGWSIMSTWIEDESINMCWGNLVTDISIRLGKGISRVILTTDIPMSMAMESIPNLDADEPGSMPETLDSIVSSLSSSFSSRSTSLQPGASEQLSE